MYKTPIPPYPQGLFPWYAIHGTGCCLFSYLVCGCFPKKFSATLPHCGKVPVTPQFTVHFLVVTIACFCSPLLPRPTHSFAFRWRVSDNGLGVDGAQHLAAALKENTTLLEIQLSSMPFEIDTHTHIYAHPRFSSRPFWPSPSNPEKVLHFRFLGVWEYLWVFHLGRGDDGCVGSFKRGTAAGWTRGGANGSTVVFFETSTSEGRPIQPVGEVPENATFGRFVPRPPPVKRICPEGGCTALSWTGPPTDAQLKRFAFSGGYFGLSVGE